MNYISTLLQKGYIGTLSNRTETVHAQKLSDDDFAARITSIKLKGILREHGKNLQKEEKS